MISLKPSKCRAIMKTGGEPMMIPLEPSKRSAIVKTGGQPWSKDDLTKSVQESRHREDRRRADDDATKAV